MASSLKSLKVADLRLVLSKAGESPPSRATKADLVSRVAASESALQVFYSLYPHLEDPHKPVQTVTEHPVIPQPSPATTNTPDSQPPPAHNSTTDSDLEKRKKRAERFEIPLSAASVDPELEKRKKRAERFGIPLVGDDAVKRETRAARVDVAGQKRSAPAEALDADELERRRKRAERFGLAKT